MENEPDKTFFSYCRKDAEFAQRLAEDLRAAGARVWLDQLDIAPGQRWDRAVEAALDQCKSVLVVLSPAAVDSTNVMDEVSAALEDGKVVIPIVFQECRIPLRLRRVQHVDFRENYERALEALLTTLGVQPPPSVYDPSVTAYPSQVHNPALMGYPLSPGYAEQSGLGHHGGIMIGPKVKHAADDASPVAMDLGTTEARVAVLEGNKAVVAEDEDGMRSVACYVSLPNMRDLERRVGYSAKRERLTRSIGAVRLLLGRNYKDVKDTFDATPYRLSRKGNLPVIVANDRTYSPVDLSALILEKLKQAAESRLGVNVAEAVIAVPEYFPDERRQAVVDAAAGAGLNKVTLVGDATAAVHAYDFVHREDSPVVVYDMGGHTFSVTILGPNPSNSAKCQTAWSESLGGYQIDQKIVDWITSQFQRQEEIDLRPDRLAMVRVYEAAERAKIELSSILQAEINLPFITADATGPKHLALKLTRASLEQMAADVIAPTVALCKEAMRKAGITPADIDCVILAGGQTSMPAVRALAEQIFSQIPERRINPAELVVMGAAAWAGALKN